MGRFFKTAIKKENVVKLLKTQASLYTFTEEIDVT